jgi:hypothetical protein
MTAPEPSEIPATSVPETPWFKSKKLWIAVPVGLVLIGLSYAIYRPAVGIAGMLTDSCSGESNAYQMWNIWLGYLWPAVMFLCALYPPFLILKNKSWGKVLLGILAGGVVTVTWYLLWAPVLWITGC